MAKIIKDNGKVPYGNQGRTRHMLSVECGICNTIYSIARDDYNRNPECMCRACSNKQKGMDALDKASNSFVSKSLKVFGTLYDYSDTIYTGARDKVHVRCYIHGLFFIRPNNHLNGQGCPTCGKESMAVTQAAEAKMAFISRAMAVHNGEYSYSNAVYISAKRKVSITCQTHGDFLQIAADHLHGSGCPKCKAASDNNAIYIWNVVGTDTYKISITSAKLGTKRIEEVAATIGAQFNIEILLHTTSALQLEKLLHSTYIQCPINIPYVNGRTEFRVLTPEELQEAIKTIKDT